MKDFGFFERIFRRLYFSMLKYLSFHNSSFAVRYFLICKWPRPQGDTPLVFLGILSELKQLVVTDRVHACLGVHFVQMVEGLHLTSMEVRIFKLTRERFQTERKNLGVLCSAK